MTYIEMFFCLGQAKYIFVFFLRIADAFIWSINIST